MVKTVRNYRLLKALGHGSFAVVYRAVDTNTNDTVAIKEISRSKITDERSKKHLDAEIRLLKEFTHPNIVRLIDHMASTNNIYLVFEFCGGGDLRGYIDKFGRLSEHTTRYFLLQLCDGLTYLNDRHIIHRDLKPQNILLTEQSPRSILKIADFGFVKYVEEASVAATMCGTPLYMAPEIVDHFEYDAKVDMWSLGCILFEMLVGKTVFLGSTQAEVLSNVKVQDVVFPSHIAVSDHMIGLLQKLLKRTPASRASVTEVQAVCNMWRGDYELPATPASTVPRTDDGSGPVERADSAGGLKESGSPGTRTDQADVTSPGIAGSIRDAGESASKGDTDDEAADDVSQTLKASYNQGPAARGNRMRTVSLDTAKAMMAYAQGPSEAAAASSRANVVGINNPRRQQLQQADGGSGSGVTNHLGPLGALGGCPGAAGTDSKDDDSGWEIINHPPPLSGLAAQQFQPSGNPTPPHGRRRSGGSGDLAGHVERGGSVLAGTSAGSKHGSPGNDADGGGFHGGHYRSSYKSNQASIRESTREDTALLEWCKRVSSMIVRVTEVADGILKKAVTPPRRQFLLHLTPEAIHQLRLEMLAQHLKDGDTGSFSGGRPPPSRRQSISSVKSQLNEFTALVNVGFIYFHVIDYLRPCVAKTANLKGGASSSVSRHTKSSPTSLSASPAGMMQGGQGQSQSAVDRVLKHLTGLLDGLQQRASDCVTCSRNIVALLEQDEARGSGGELSPNRLGAGLDALIEGVQLTKAPSAEVLIYNSAQQNASDACLFRSLGNYKQALNSLEIAQVLLDYILLWTKDSVDRGNIEKFIKLICAEIEICRQHDAL